MSKEEEVCCELSVLRAAPLMGKEQEYWDPH